LTRLEFPDKIPVLINWDLSMFTNILQYITNADDYYRLWMVAQLQHPDQKMIQYAGHWMPELVEQFDDKNEIPDSISFREANGHQVDSEMRFHAGNVKPTIDITKGILGWGPSISEYPILTDRIRQMNTTTSIFGMRTVGPCTVTLTGLKMWHHQDTLHRRRGDAVICDMAVFEWNTKTTKGSFRESGPFQVVIKGFRAAINKGEASDASFEFMNVSWGTEDGIRLGETKVNQIIGEYNIKVNYLNTDNVFGDEGEEFIFWDEIGRSREVA